MKLNDFVASRKRAIFEELRSGNAPSEGSFDPKILEEGRRTGAQPQIGSEKLEPHAMTLEFLFAEPRGKAVVFPVRMESPERIVFLPVPGWVIESIWQGEVAGSFHFESDAHRLVEDFSRQLESGSNAQYFERQAASRRE